MGRKKQWGHFKQHADGNPHPREKAGKGNNRDYAPRCPDFTQGQKDPAIRALLDQEFAQLTLIIYGPRLSGTHDFQDKGDFGPPPPPKNGQEPLEAFGKFYAGDIFKDLESCGLVLTGARFRSRDEKEFGDKQGKNYIYLTKKVYLRPGNDKKVHYLYPGSMRFNILHTELSTLQLRKIQLLVAFRNNGGTKHTLKLFTGNHSGNRRLEKPVWKPATRTWALETAHP